MSTGLLDQELRTYEAEKRELLSGSEGAFVLILGDEVAGTYDSIGDALREGYERFGNVPFLVRQITQVETPVSFVTNLLGI